MDVRKQSRRRSLNDILVEHLRGLTTVFLGLVIYLLLFTTFGDSHIKSLGTTSDGTFPRKIWQSWKIDPLKFEDRDAERARSWLLHNPDLRYEVLTDTNALPYVRQVFGPSGFNRPDIVQTYTSLKATIIKADLLRYIIMYAEGGIYADIDVEALKSFDHFVPQHYQEQDLDMIIGIETDEPDFKDHLVLGKKAQSFCQWTFVCKPRLPVMLRLIDNILLWLNGLAQKQGKSISEIDLDFDEVLTGTGPSAFTTALLAQMSHATGRTIDWNSFHGLEESMVLGRVLVLPSEAFAAGTGHSNSGNHGAKRALVKHHFHASSWTKSHPRYKHPVYDEVERCNWDMECVKLWDMNTAHFETLSEQEKIRMMGLKKLEDSKSPNSES